MVVPLDATGYNQYSTVRAAAGLAIPQATLLPITPPSIGTPFGLHPNMPEMQALFNQQPAWPWSATWARWSSR